MNARRSTRRIRKTPKSACERAATISFTVLLGVRSRGMIRQTSFHAYTSATTEFARFNAKSSRQDVDPKAHDGRSPLRDWVDSRAVRHDASVESCARSNFGACTRGSTPVGDGAVAFATRPGAVVWQPEHSRGNRAADTISAAPLLHAHMGSHPNSAWPVDSLSVARPHRKHSRHAHPYWYRHRLHLRDCQSLGRSVDAISANCARLVGMGTFCGRFAFLVAPLRLVSTRLSRVSSCICADSLCGAAWLRGSWDDNDSACTKRSAMDARDEGARRPRGSTKRQVARGAEGLGRAV